MSNIGSRTFNLIGDKYLTLANEEFVRTLAIGSDWTRLRLGLLLALTPDGTNDLQGADLVWGLCAGKTNPFGAASTTNFLGMKFGTSFGPEVLNYSANGGNPYFWSGRGQMKKVGVTRTAFDGNGLEFHRLATNTGALQRRSAHFLEIAKGNPNFSIRSWSMPLTGLAKDFTPAHLLEGLEQSLSITVNGENVGAGMTVTTGFDEAPGALDTVDLHWNKAAFPLGVYALAAYRIA